MLVRTLYQWQRFFYPGHSGFCWSRRWWGGNGISWTICKSFAAHSRQISRQITMPVPYHSSFLQFGCSSCHPSNSVKALKCACVSETNSITKLILFCCCFVGVDFCKFHSFKFVFYIATFLSSTNYIECEAEGFRTRGKERKGKMIYIAPLYYE